MSTHWIDTAANKIYAYILDNVDGEHLSMVSQKDLWRIINAAHEEQCVDKKLSDTRLAERYAEMLIRRNQELEHRWLQGGVFGANQLAQSSMIANEIAEFLRSKK